MPNLYEIQIFLATYLPKAILAAAIIIAAFYFGRWLRRLVEGVLKRSGADPGVTILLGQMTYWAITGLGILAAVGLFVDLTALIAGLGLVGFALTFAFQDVLKNFMAGILLQVQRPFLVGEYVELMSYQGTVKAVHMRSTEVLTGEGLTVMLPNASVLDNPIVNFARTPQRRLDISFTLPYDCDLDRVRSLALQAVESLPNRLSSPAADVLFEDASGGLTLKARVWVDTRKPPGPTSKDRALSLLYTTLKQEGIEFRYPRQEVSVFMQESAPPSSAP
jgi:small conductance mechanosensitive channel